MSTNIEKIIDIISKLSSLQQNANIQQNFNTQEPMNGESPSGTTSEKYIYISKEDLTQLFPSLEGKLDLSKIISTLLGSISVVKEPSPDKETAPTPPNDENKDEEISNE